VTKNNLVILVEVTVEADVEEDNNKTMRMIELTIALSIRINKKITLSFF